MYMYTTGHFYCAHVHMYMYMHTQPAYICIHVHVHVYSSCSAAWAATVGIILAYMYIVLYTCACIYRHIIFMYIDAGRVCFRGTCNGTVFPDHYVIMTSFAVYRFTEQFHRGTDIIVGP